MRDPKFWTTARCSTCDSEFELRRSRKKKARSLFCSLDCYRSKCSVTHVTRICENCQSEFVRPQSVKQTRFCSWACYREFAPPQARSGTRGNFGHYVSIKGGGKVHFDSSWELRRMKELDADGSVVSWRRSHHRIPWRDVTGKDRIYYPDFDVLYSDGSKVTEEVKGYCDENSQLKIEAGRRYFDRLYDKLQCGYRVLNSRSFDDVEIATERYDNEFGTWTRPTFENVFMQSARILSERSTCVRLQVGAVFTDPEFTRVLCLGYNGGITGDENQCESLKPGACGCIHAEVNAMMKATESLRGSVLFVTIAPCKACAKLIVARGVTKVFFGRGYRSKQGTALLRRHGVQVISWGDYTKACDEAFFNEQFEEETVKPQLPLPKDADACCSVVGQAILMADDEDAAGR